MDSPDDMCLILWDTNKHAFLFTVRYRDREGSFCTDWCNNGDRKIMTAREKENATDNRRLTVISTHHLGTVSTLAFIWSV